MMKYFKIFYCKVYLFMLFDDLFGLTSDYDCFVSLYTGLGSTLFDIIVKLTLCVLYITRIQFDEVELYAWYVQLLMVLLLHRVGSGSLWVISTAVP